VVDSQIVNSLTLPVYTTDCCIYFQMVRPILGNTEQRMKIGVLIDMNKREINYYAKKRNFASKEIPSHIKVAVPVFSVVCGSSINLRPQDNL